MSLDRRAVDDEVEALGEEGDHACHVQGVMQWFLVGPRDVREVATRQPGGPVARYALVGADAVALGRREQIPTDVLPRQVVAARQRGLEVQDRPGAVGQDDAPEDNTT